MFVLVFLFVNSPLLAATYTTISSGNWNNNSIWSLDGGATPCNCRPGNDPNGHTIIIKHQVQLVANTRIRNGILTIDGPNGELTGNHNLLLEDNTVGTVKSGGKIHNVASIVVKRNSVLIVEDNGYVGSGFDLSVEDNSTLNVNYIGEVYLSNFRMQGNSTLILDGFMEISGNFTTTNSSHNVSGAGGLLVHGNINLGNNTSWSGLAWCLEGSGTSNAPAGSNDCAHVYAIKGALPVQLVFFRAMVNADEVLLKWSTALEVNNDHFVVEKSTDGNQFFEVGRVRGKINSTDTSHYQFMDRYPAMGINYYRLKQVDMDGRFSYSDVVSATLPSYTRKGNPLSIYPNPSSNGMFEIKYYATENSPALRSLQIYDLNGKMLDNKTIHVNTYPHLNLVRVSGVPKGAFIIMVHLGNQSFSEKIIVLD